METGKEGMARGIILTLIVLAIMTNIQAAGPDDRGTPITDDPGSLVNESSLISQGIDKSMVYIKSGIFKMGFENGYPDEMPIHKVKLSSFYIDKFEVTNRQFKEFADVTGYVTSSENDGYCRSYIEGPVRPIMLSIMSDSGAPPTLRGNRIIRTRRFTNEENNY